MLSSFEDSATAHLRKNQAPEKLEKKPVSLQSTLYCTTNVTETNSAQEEGRRPESKLIPRNICPKEASFTANFKFENKRKYNFVNWYSMRSEVEMLYTAPQYNIVIKLLSIFL